MGVLWGDWLGCGGVKQLVLIGWWPPEQKLAKLKNRPSRTEWNDGKMGIKQNISVMEHIRRYKCVYTSVKENINCT